MHQEDIAAFPLGEKWLTAQKLAAMGRDSSPTLEIAGNAWEKLRNLREVVDQVVSSGRVVYGLNTGFGFLAEVAIDKAKLDELQTNLIRSHACGVGPAVANEIVRAVIILKIHNFLLGGSGVSVGCVEFLRNMVTQNILPIIPEQGSVGACGDLAPLAHLALAMLGEGEAYYQGHVRPMAEVMELCSLKPYQPRPKEGLSLINGTQFLTTLAAFAVADAQTLALSADIIAALSLDAFRGTPAAFDPRIHQLRKQKGQAAVAANLSQLFFDDQIIASHSDCGKVQDPYSFRCIPQVHGAIRDTLEHVESVVERELNSVTDNPLIFEDGSTLSGGNFHGQPVAMAMDFLAIAMAELGSISERRTEKLTNPHLSGLPPFIVAESGLNSGFMIPHVVAAALVSENKVLSHPASVDSIPTSADKEDHVSMGPIASRKCLKIIENTSNILAIELLSACQGIDLLAPLRPSAPLLAVWKEVRKISQPLQRDRSLSRDIEQVSKWIRSGGIVRLLEGMGLSLV